MIKQFIASILCIIFMLTACEDKTKDIPIPKNILSIEKIGKVLSDYALAESAANLNIKGVIHTQIDSTYAFNPLIENNIRQSQFDSSLDFYCSHGDLYKKVYENVLDRLTEFESKKNNMHDSIKLK